MSVPFEIPDWLMTADSGPPDNSAVDPHRVEDLVNRFIAAKHEALFSAPDAYYRNAGRVAVDGAPGILDRLNGLRQAALDAANDDGTRAMLAPRLDAHLDDATDGIGRRIAAQRDSLTRQIISERQNLIQRAAQLEHNNDGKLAGLAEAHASAAQELARMNGEPEEPAMDEARSAIWRTAIDHRLTNGSGPQAITLFDQVKDQLAPADQRHLELPIQNAVLNRTADQWIAREAAKPGDVLSTRLQSDPDLSPLEKAVARLKLDARDSVQESDRAIAAKGLDDRLGTIAQALTTAPGTYRPGALSALANAYQDAGATDSASAVRPIATHEPLLLPFAQLSAGKQTAALDALPEEARPAAKAIQRDQAAAFARDAFAAGTALYPDVGAPVPADDIAGRTVQARKIAERRGVPVAPFTADEITAIRRIVADGSPEQRRTLLTHIDTLPNDMKAALAPLLTPPHPTGVPSAVDRNGIQLAKADATAPSDKPGGEGQGRQSTFPLDTDFEAFKRELEKDREHVAAEQATEGSGGQGVPPTEPAAGSPEYQAPDAEARRIVAGQEQGQPSPASQHGGAQLAPSPPSVQAGTDSAPQTPRTTSVAVPAVPAAGGLAGEIADAVVNASKKAGARLVDAAKSIVGLPGIAGEAAGSVAGAAVGAVPLILIPTNTQSETHPIGDGLRVRTAPGQRTAAVELRVGEGFLGPGSARNGSACRSMPNGSRSQVSPAPSPSISRASMPRCANAASPWPSRQRTTSPTRRRAKWESGTTTRQSRRSRSRRSIRRRW